MTTLHIARLSTPLGDLLGAIDPAGALVRLDFHDGRDRPTTLAELRDALVAAGFAVRARHEPAAFTRLRSALAAYFDGDGRALDELPVAPIGTEFQRGVWDGLRAIPAGETRTYGDLARALGRPSAARAVGAANGANRIALVVPCHRVVGADGTLTGYAGGIWRKRALLRLEGAGGSRPGRAAV